MALRRASRSTRLLRVRVRVRVRVGVRVRVRVRVSLGPRRVVVQTDVRGRQRLVVSMAIVSTAIVSPMYVAASAW